MAILIQPRVNLKINPFKVNVQISTDLSFAIYIPRRLLILLNTKKNICSLYGLMVCSCHSSTGMRVLVELKDAITSEEEYLFPIAFWEP